MERLNKKQILEKMQAELEREIKTLQEAAKDAREAATNEESKPENKYDTRGLEASYLAGAQAKRAQEVAEVLDILRTLQFQQFDETTPIGITAVIEVLVNDEDTKHFFMVPRQGGMKLKVGKLTLQTLSPDSPLGQLLHGKTVGASFELKVKGSSKEYEIVDVY